MVLLVLLDLLGRGGPPRRPGGCGLAIPPAGVNRRCGELPARHTDARSLLIAATAPLCHQLVLLRAQPDPHLPERAAEAAVLAAAAGAFSVRREESA